MTLDEIIMVCDEIRKDAGYNYEDVCEKLHISKNTYYAWRNGLHLGNVRKIMEFMDMLGIEIELKVKEG